MQSNTPYSIGGEPALATPRWRIPLPIKLLLPAFLAVGLVVVLPLLFSFYTSFTAYRLTDPDTLALAARLEVRQNDNADPNAMTPIRVELDLAEPVGRARCHGPGLAGRLVGSGRQARADERPLVEAAR